MLQRAKHTEQGVIPARLEQLLEHGVEEAGQERRLADARVRTDRARDAAALPGRRAQKGVEQQRQPILGERAQRPDVPGACIQKGSLGTCSCTPLQKVPWRVLQEASALMPVAAGEQVQDKLGTDGQRGTKQVAGRAHCWAMAGV